MSDHTLPKSLRQRIRELILAQAATKDIVDQLKTSKEYVYKERGKLKREGLLVTHQSLSTSNGQSEITVVKDQPHLMEYVEHDGSGTIHRVNDYDIPPLDKKNLMSMYEEFQNQKGPAYVTAKHGIHPETSQEEFERFLVMSSRDPYDLQDKLTATISDPPPEIQSLINKSSQHVLLTNNEIISIVTFKMWNYADSRIQNLVLDTLLDLPPGLDRVTCMICHRPFTGVVYDKNSEIGPFVEYNLSNFLCERCKLLREDIAQRKDLVT
ncbi:MAG: hypothetical protein WCE91_03725 [Nitrososphaeraceae archaeon]